MWDQDAAVGSAVLTNPCTRICFRVGDWDAKKLAEGFSSFNATDLQSLGVGEAICRVERAEHDFSLKTLAPPAVDPAVAEAVRGYRVKQRYQPVSPDDAEIRKRAIAQVLVRRSGPPR